MQYKRHYSHVKQEYEQFIYTSTLQHIKRNGNLHASLPDDLPDLPNEHLFTLN